MRVDRLTQNFWLLLIKEEGLEKPDVGQCVVWCVYMFGIFGSGDVHLWDSTAPHSGGRQVGKVGSRDKKNHAVISLHQIYWEKNLGL